MSKYRNFIAGEWADSAAWAPNINPSDVNDVIGEYAHADEQQMRQAIEAARAAFADWSLVSPQVRADALDQIGSEILSRKAELGDLLAREEGKTLPEAVGEVARAGQIFKFFAGEALRVVGDKQLSVRSGIEIEVTREPLGVIGIIAPWNFPIAIPAWKIAPALAYGNCVVFKPADLVPGCAWALTDIISRAGLPSGVFNLVMGRGRVVGEIMLNHREVDAISFTGSTTTGARVAAACVARNAKFQLEMGGKNPLVVLDDANLEIAVNCAIQGAFFSTGQRCTASSRLIVQAGVHDRFMAAMIERMRPPTWVAVLKWIRPSLINICATSTSPGAKALRWPGEVNRFRRRPPASSWRRRCLPKPLAACASTARRSSGRWPASSGSAATRRRWRWPTILSSAWPAASAPPR